MQLKPMLEILVRGEKSRKLGRNKLETKTKFRG